MAQPSKFTGALSRLREQEPPPAKESAAPPRPPRKAATEAEPARGRGRPRGKRSDPAFQPSTLLLREQTKRAAMRRLEDEGGHQDLSDLVEELLADWVKR